jgi:hypothetical protein
LQKKLVLFIGYSKNDFIRVHFRMSRVGGDTNPDGAPWALSPPTTFQAATRHFEIHPFIPDNNLITK